jgi:hypothetical protein
MILGDNDVASSVETAIQSHAPFGSSKTLLTGQSLKQSFGASEAPLLMSVRRNIFFRSDENPTSRQNIRWFGFPDILPKISSIRVVFSNSGHNVFVSLFSPLLKSILLKICLNDIPASLNKLLESLYGIHFKPLPIGYS